MDIRATLVGLLALAPGVLSHLAPRTLIYPSANSTSSGLPSTSQATPSCCFIVQDTVYEEWWEIYKVSTLYEPINVTSITTLITPYMNSTVTNYETHIYSTSASSLFTAQDGRDPVKLYNHNAPGPTEVQITLSSLNGTQIVTAGVTVQSPAAFWVYSTVKVINVPAVTDSNGQVVCATSSALGYNVPDPTQSTTFSEINSNAEAYFGGYDIGLSAGAQRNLSTPTYSGYTISFPTPFIYNPPRGATGATGLNTDGCWTPGLKEDYGYVPSSVIKYVTDHPDISSQYPGIASCLAGGPSILIVTSCVLVAPEINFSATDLTEHTIITVGGNAVSPPTPVPAAVIAPATTGNLAASVDVPIQQSQVQAFTPAQTPAASAQATPPQGTAVNEVATSATIFPPGPQPPAAQTSVAVADTVIQPAPLPPAAQTSVAAAGTVGQPGQQPPTIQTSGAAAVPGPSSLVIIGPTTIPVNPATPLPGSTTTISSTPFVIIPSPTTILLPANTTPAISLPSGQTTTISGTPVVIISGVQTIPVNTAFSVSGATTVVGGTTTIVSGTPTVVGGTTAVVISGTQTVALPTSIQRTGAPSAPIQLTSIAIGSYALGNWRYILLGMFLGFFIQG